MSTVQNYRQLISSVTFLNIYLIILYHLTSIFKKSLFIMFVKHIVIRFVLVSSINIGISPKTPSINRATKDCIIIIILTNRQTDECAVQAIILIKHK